MSYGAAANRRPGERTARAPESYDYDDQDGAAAMERKKQEGYF